MGWGSIGGEVRGGDEEASSRDVKVDGNTVCVDGHERLDSMR